MQRSLVKSALPLRGPGPALPDLLARTTFLSWFDPSCIHQRVSEQNLHMSTFATFPICAPRHGKLRRLVCSDLQTCHGRPVCATELRSLTATTGNPDPPHAFVNPIRIREPSGSSPTRELQSRARSGARKSSQSELETMLWTADPQGRTNRSGRTKTARTETTILIPTAHIPHAHLGPAVRAQHLKRLRTSHKRMARAGGTHIRKYWTPDLPCRTIYVGVRHTVICIPAAIFCSTRPRRCKYTKSNPGCAPT